MVGISAPTRCRSPARPRWRTRGRQRPQTALPIDKHTKRELSGRRQVLQQSDRGQLQALRCRREPDERRGGGYAGQDEKRAKQTVTLERDRTALEDNKGQVAERQRCQEE